MRYPSFFYSVHAALRGIEFAFVRERNFRVEIVVAIGVVFLLVVLHARIVQYGFAFILITMVLAAELINTMCERIVDILKPQKHPYARVIKDLSAGMVLVVALGALCGGIMILLSLM